MSIIAKQNVNKYLNVIKNNILLKLIDKNDHTYLYPISDFHYRK